MIKIEFEKQAKYRILIKDLEKNKTKTITIYKNGSKHTLDQFVKILKEKLREV